MNTKTIKTSSPEETIKAGKGIGKTLKPGDCLALIGDLGTGKTTIIKGIALGYGVSEGDIVTSPTFIIVNEYKGKTDLFHVDLYRIKRYKELEDACIDDYFKDDAVVLIEWADRFPELLPKSFTEIKITRLGETQRQITVEAK